MVALDDTTLMAYVDGELDEQTARLVEAQLERNYEARATVAKYRETASVVRSAVLPYGHAPIPERLIDAIGAGRPHLPVRRFPTNGGWVRSLSAIAAGLLLLLVGGGGGFLAATYRFDAFEAELMAQRATVERYRHEAVQSALTTLVSGKAMDWTSEHAVQGRIVPIRTFKNRKGQYCREYRDELSREGAMSVQYGIACRHDDKVWRNTYVLVPSGPAALDGGMKGAL